MTEFDRDRALQQLQRNILEAVAAGRPLAAIMELLCGEAETLAPGVICSVLSVDAEGRLHHLAAPSLPAHYSDAIDGLPIGPCVGSCGTAAHRGEPVEVVDIAEDPLWAEYKALALPLGLRACWSSPIKASDGRVIGTFAFYYRIPRGPSGLDRRIVDTCIHLCAIAIEHADTRERIHQLAFCDALTGLPNRASFQQRAAQALAAAAATGATLAIHSVDLDDFKGVNDTLGHWVGDILLERVARRLAASLSPGEFVARLGGDEFAIIQTDVRDRDQVTALARHVASVFEEPFEIEEQQLFIGASIGIVQAPHDGCELVDLLRKADLALYRAKHEGRGRFKFFTPDMHDRILAARALQHDLRRAVAEGEFELFYQPLVSLASNTPVGVEALIRWNHPTRGRIPPTEFIPAAEETGLIVPLGAWILREACRQAAAWPDEISVAVNLSPLQLRRTSFVLDVVRAITAVNLAPSRLEVEITETVPLTDPAMRKTLQQIHNLGVKISLDDFGTGYSSLSYLRSFPFDRIKIDRSFVRDLGLRGDSTSIVRAVVGLGRDLGIRTTAEGIETEQQLAWLKSAGCTEGQGYYFSEPRPAAEITPLFGRAVAPTGRRAVRA